MFFKRLFTRTQNRRHNSNVHASVHMFHYPQNWSFSTPAHDFCSTNSLETTLMGWFFQSEVHNNISCTSWICFVLFLYCLGVAWYWCDWFGFFLFFAIILGFQSFLIIYLFIFVVILNLLGKRLTPRHRFDRFSSVRYIFCILAIDISHVHDIWFTV